MKVRVNAKNVSVRRLAGLVISSDVHEMDITPEQFAILSNDEYVSIVKAEEESDEQDVMVFGKKASAYTTADLDDLRTKAKGKGNTKEGKLAKELIKKLEEESDEQDGD
ncbi:MAG: hypothetical protein ACI37O_07755 [Candidatus Avelusimicrobium sp.]|uniref:hypothetical protein n=1 Tax=Candidatus Avelusimicrobium sp. TaxID=3048833 RepID=UPI003EFE8AE0